MHIKEIEKIAYLARLKIPKSEINKYKDSLTDILKFVEQINQDQKKLDVEPMSHPLDIKQPLREDEVTETNQIEKLQSIASKNVEAGLYLVSQVIE